MACRPQTIVVGVDRSPTSVLALEQALCYAEADADVHCIQVLEPEDPEPPPSARGESVDPLSYSYQRLHELVHDVGGKHVNVELHIGTGSPAEQIAALAEKLDADLVIVGTHGRRGFSRLWMGSCAEAVVRRAPCPVLVVRPKLPFGATRPRTANTTLPPPPKS